MAEESASKDVEMAVEGEKEVSKETEAKTDKQQSQKDKDLLTFEGERVATRWENLAEHFH